MMITKAMLAPRHAASKDETRYRLTMLRFRADGATEASDGHVHVKVEAATRSPGSAFSVPVTDLKGVKMRDLPLTLHGGASDGLYLDSRGPYFPDADYPDTDGIESLYGKQKVRAELRLDITLLETLCKAVREFAGTTGQVPINLEIRRDSDPVRVTAENGNGDRLTASVMPMRRLKGDSNG